jgi:hypothetical protein
MQEILSEDVLQVAFLGFMSVAGIPACESRRDRPIPLY